MFLVFEESSFRDYDEKSLPGSEEWRFTAIEEPVHQGECEGPHQDAIADRRIRIFEVADAQDNEIGVEVAVMEAIAQTKHGRCREHGTWLSESVGMVLSSGHESRHRFGVHSITR